MAEKTIELLSPAGDMERLRMSLAYGADAVYLAGPDFGMRSFAGNFTPEELKQAVELCHSRGVAVHVTCNTMPRNDEAARLPEWLEFLQAAGVDAAILADVGVLSLLKKHAPGVKAHISTQASVSNYQAAAAWYELGASRVILARELSLDEIREIRAKAPPALELEAFVHGAMCVSYSGRCLLSNYMTGRDANRGACAQPCRYQYALVEEKRPGEYFPIGEDAGGAFILNSRDMCMIDHVPELMDAGLDSLKIEGRAKSAYYAAIVTAAYRHAIDAAQAGEPLDPVWRAEVDKVSHRPYSTGFYYGEPGQHTAHARYLRDWQVVGVVTSCAPDGAALCELRNKFAEGDELELVGPGVRPVSFRAEGLTDGDGLPILEARKPQMPFRLSLPSRPRPCPSCGGRRWACERAVPTPLGLRSAAGGLHGGGGLPPHRGRRPAPAWHPPVALLQPALLPGHGGGAPVLHALRCAAPVPPPDGGAGHPVSPPPAQGADPSAGLVGCRHRPGRRALRPPGRPG